MQKPKPQVIVFGLLAIALLAGSLALAKNPAACTENYRRDGRLMVGQSNIDIQIAKNPSEQEVGLGGRRCLGQNQGMLFVFNKPGYYPFWMKNMELPIDIIWIDSNNNVVDEEQNVQPNSYPHTYVNQSPAKKVLEMAAGSIKTLNIGTGTHIN